MFRSINTYRHRFIVFLFIYFCLACINAYAEDKTENHFYFVQMTDTHFGDDNHLKKAKKAIKYINKLPMKIQCVVHTGDITMDKLDDKEVIDESLAVLSRLKVPIHYVPGNNDISLHRLEPTTNAFVENFGELISMAEYQNVVFLFVYTEPLRKAFSIKGYDPLKQIESYLNKSKGKPVIIFHHAPCVSDFYKNTFHDKWDEQNKKKWIKLVNRYNVKAVIAGHFHRAEHHWLGNVPLYVAAPISGYLGRQASFRIYEYNNGKIGYRTQYIK
ncbi:MAG: metallophosphoesterase [Desulfobacterales bacterium]|nr:metallophosphoesterase [Desulfobacterales bacterium]